MPYRIDLNNPPPDAADRLVDLGALDVEDVHGGIAAIIPDGIAVAAVTSALGQAVRVTPALGRDAGSVWVVQPRATRVARWRIAPARWPPRSGELRLIDGPVFGTGLHATTALCLEALDQELDAWQPECVLDVGAGSGVLALAALSAGVPRAVALDTDEQAVRVTAENARLNGLTSRLAIVGGAPEALTGAWPLVMANILAAPLIAMAPILVRRVGRSGRLVLSGIPAAVASDVERAYVRRGMRQVRTQQRDGWTALTFHASW